MTPPRRKQTLRQAAEDLSDSESGAGLLATYYIRTNQLVRRRQPPTLTSLAKHPKSTPLKVAYLRLLILNKDIPKARTVGAELAKTDPNVPEVAVLNGMILLNDGKTNDAFNRLQKAAKANPDSLVGQDLARPRRSCQGRHDSCSTELPRRGQAQSQEA